MHVDVILLERVAKLGQIGDIVSVKSGYARNFLIPNKKALRATEANKADFSARKAQIEAQNLESRAEAEKIAERMHGCHIILIRQASEKGQLYGSVSSNDIAEQLNKAGYTVHRHQVFVANRFKMLGIFDVDIMLHAEVRAQIKMNVANSEDEAQQQWARYERGEPVLMTAAEEEAIEEQQQAEAALRRGQEKALKVASDALKQAAAEESAYAETKTLTGDGETEAGEASEAET